MIRLFLLLPAASLAFAPGPMAATMKKMMMSSADHSALAAAPRTGRSSDKRPGRNYGDLERDEDGFWNDDFDYNYQSESQQGDRFAGGGRDGDSGWPKQPNDQKYSRRGQRGGGSDSSRRGGPRQDGRRRSGNDQEGRSFGRRNSQRGGQVRNPKPHTATSAPQEDEITDTNKHFFSKKPLNDKAFRYETDDQDNKELFTSLCLGAGITRPSRIQSLAWPQILTGKHVVVADQTGSGKTLAYLIPLLQKALGSDEPKKKVYGAPKVLVLAPTAELADQIREVCSKISQTVPFKTMVVTANGKFTTSIRDQIRIIQRQPVDVMISTPGRVSTILRTRNSGLDLSRLQTIVLDEVDILLVDQTFGPQLRTVGAAAPLNQTQFVFCTATLPDKIVEKVQAEFPGVIQVRGPGLHRVAPTVKERLIDVSVPSKFNRDSAYCFNIKAKELLRSLQTTPCRRTLIFCNTVESCRQVENLLTRKDRRGKVYNVGSYHNAMTPEARNANLDAFSRAGEGNDNDFDGNNGRRGKKQELVDHILVCTDRAARGVDFDASPVDHVVIFDFPKDPAEYVRRVGRTARAGRTGASTVFAYGWQLPIARSVLSGKLETITTTAFDEQFEEDEDKEEYKLDDDDGGYYLAQKRPKRKKNMESIKTNIEGGRMWE